MVNWSQTQGFRLTGLLGNDPQWSSRPEVEPEKNLLFFQSAIYA